MSQQPYELGDVSFHRGWTFHRAEPNRTATPRRVMTIIYLDADLTLATPRNDHQAADMAQWMPGVEPGEVPETPLTPVLYRADEGTPSD